MTIKERGILFCIAMLFSFSSILPNMSFGSTELEGVDWRLVEAEGSPLTPPTEGKIPYIVFDPVLKKATGYTGCNIFFGQYELDGPSLKFVHIGSTRRACPDTETAIETVFLKALNETRGWKIMEGELQFLDNTRVLARFLTGKEKETAVDPGSITYRSKSFPSGAVTLSRGEYRAPAVPGSASEIMVKLSDRRAFGIINGKETGAVVLVTSPGGTGTFYDLALLSKHQKGWENSDTVLLGDRVKVHSVSIENDHIVVAMTVHGSHDPLCCPTVGVKKRFAVRNDRLVPVAGEQKAGEPQITGTVWQWVQTLYNNDTKTVPAKPENYTIRFLENGNIEVKADCNQKGGTYSVEGKKLSIKLTISTMAACEPGSLEDAFVKDLTEAAIVFLKDGNLYLDLKYDTGTMNFSGQSKD